LKKLAGPVDRHRERSDAIQTAMALRLDGSASLAMTINSKDFCY
jgi:hypothetical protein